MSLLAELHRERLGAEAPALARVARARDEEAAELVVADRALVLVGIVVVVASSASRRRRRGAPRGAGRCRRSLLASRAVALRGLRAPRRRVAPPSPKRMRVLRASSGSFAHGDVGVDAERLDGARELGRERDRAAPAPREDDAFAQRAPRIADDALGIDDGARAEAVARGARAVRAVEREHARLDRRQRDAAVDAGEALASSRTALRPRPATSRRPSPILSASSTQSVRRPLTPSLRTMRSTTTSRSCGLAAIELDLVAEVDDRAVDARAHEALAAQALELELELALARAARWARGR